MPTCIVSRRSARSRSTSSRPGPSATRRSCVVIRLAPDRRFESLRGPLSGCAGLVMEAVSFVRRVAPGGRVAGGAASSFAGVVARAVALSAIAPLAQQHAHGSVNEKSRLLAGFSLQLVPRRGLEPPRLAALVPETSASTNSAIWAGRRIIAEVIAPAKYFVASSIAAMEIDIVSESEWAADHMQKANEQQKSRSEERLSCETGAQKRTRTSTPRGAST
ncbi:protein of unknown function [Thauera humireducens]|nr:protein of unknown function [Thauera humireducens]